MCKCEGSGAREEMMPPVASGRQRGEGLTESGYRGCEPSSQEDPSSAGDENNWDQIFRHEHQPL